MSRLAPYVLLLLGCLPVSAQQLDTVSKTLYIDSVWIRDAVPVVDDKPDGISDDVLAFNAANSLAQVIAGNTGVYVKSYGASNLATISMRGLAASQTKVYWNGLSVNSSMNGTIDLQTLPMGLLGDVQLQHAETSLNVAAGSFGGALQTASKAPVNTLQISATQEVGSFGTANSLLKLGGGKGKWKQQGGLIYRRAENNYKFVNTTLSDEPVQTQTNSALMQAGGMYELYHTSGFSFKNLTTYTDREIPPTMLTPNNREQQQDWLSLHQLAHQKQVKAHTLTSQLSYKYDLIRYENPLALLDAPSQTHAAIASFQSAGALKHGFKYTLRADHTSQWAASDGFTGVRRQNVTGLFGTLLYRVKWFKASYTMRQDLIDGQLAPYLPALELGASVKKRWNISVIAQRNYRYPTLNDLYWQPGGNPALQPEKGLNLELRNKLQLLNKPTLKLNLSNTAYYMDIQNWILWQPAAFGYWSPQNVKEVVSKGVENELSMQVIKAVQAELLVSYHFNQATTKATTNPTDASLGKLLIYSPQHILNLSLTVKYKGWYLYYNQNYTALRYATSDNSQQLEPFTLGNLRVGKQLTLPNGHSTEFYLTVENLWNTQYQSLAWRPMPGTAFRGGITYQFNKS